MFTRNSLFVLVGVVAFAMVALMALWAAGLRDGSADPVQAAALRPDSIMADSTTRAPMAAAAPSYVAVLDTGTFSASFPKFDGLGGWHEVIEHFEVDESGRKFVTKTPGNPHLEDIILARSLSDNFDLWNWRQQVLDGQMDLARVDGSVTIVEVRPRSQRPIARWSFAGGWPCAYDVSPDPDVSGGPAETIKICYEELAREELEQPE